MDILNTLHSPSPSPEPDTVSASPSSYQDPSLTCLCPQQTCKYHGGQKLQNISSLSAQQKHLASGQSYPIDYRYAVRKF